jgi:hypothetical protein
MRFAVAHKVSTYLMVGFALFGLVGGGALGPIVTAGAAFGLLVSWFWEPPRIRYERWAWVWTVLSLLAMVYGLVTAIATSDYLGVAATFLVWLTITKACNRRVARDWQQMYLLAFLMLVAGSVLNPDLTYGVCFLGYVISATWALTLFHLRREMEDNLLVKHAADRASERVEVRRILDSRRIVGGRFFFGTGVLSFGVFLMSAVVFLALPRVGIGFFLKSQRGLTMSGFSDGVKLGGHGVIKLDSTVVMRVEVDSNHGGRQAPQIHWRGVAFDRYRDGQWSRSWNAQTTRQTLEQSKTRDRRVLLYTGNALPISEIEQLAATSVKQSVWLEPLDSNVLFGASMPRIVEYGHTIRRRSVLERNDEIRLEHGSTVHYTVYSSLGSPPPEELERATPSQPGFPFHMYTQLPPEITQRTRDLAQRITAGLTTQYAKVVAIQDWLRKNATYTLKLEDPGKQEPVDFFLFDRKQGHCEYFASAFAILARAVGIPTRNVNGFLGGEWNEYQGYVAVRAGDAHSWDEVFYPGIGADGSGRWVTVDPTPPGAVDQLGRGGSGIGARLGRILDTLRFQWTKWVIEYDLVSQIGLFKSVGGALKSAAKWVKNGFVWLARLAADHWPITTILAGILTVIVILRRRKRRRLMPVEARAVKRERGALGDIYHRLARVLAKAGFARASALTPRELAERMRNAGHPAADDVAELTELYYAAEWGARHDPTAEARATELARRIRETISRRRAA